MYKRILVPVDGSETARSGLLEAIRLAKTLGAALRIVNVIEESTAVYPSLGGDLLQQLLDQLRRAGESILVEATTAAGTAVPVDTRLIEALGASVGSCIVAAAAEWPADLIVCGTHGRRGFRRLVMGSDAEYVVRHSPVPVLLVRAAPAT
jgi:nucleotide-binding universal stress UspA family protein